MKVWNVPFVVVLGFFLMWGCSPSTTNPSDAGSGNDSAAEATPPENSQSDNSGSSVKEGSIKVVAYNVHGLPGGITGDDTNKRLKLIGPKLNDFVIAGLQEVFTDDGHKNLMEGIKHPHKHRFSKPLEGRAMGSGLLLLSQFEAAESKEEYFNDCNGTLDGASDCLASKGFQMVRYKISPGVEIDVYNSHFEAGSGAKDQDARAKNVVQVREAMLKWSKGRAIIYLGDTNLKQTRENDQKALKEWMTTVGLTDSCEAVDCPKKGRIDRVLFRSGDSVSLEATSWNIPEDYVYEGSTPLSDHDPIVVDLTWKRK